MKVKVTPPARMRKPKLLIVSAVPPPLSGPEVMTAHLLEGNLGEWFEFQHYNIGKSRSISEKGKVDLKNIGFGLWQPCELFFRLWRGNYDVVYTDLAQNRAGFFRYASFIWIASIFRCKVATRVMGDGFRYFYNRSRFPAFIRATLARIDCLIVRAESLKSQFDGIVEQNKVKVVYSGVPIPHSIPEVRKGKVLRFLYLGYLTHAKGAFDFLRAVRAIRRELPEAEFVMVGPRVDAPERNITYVDGPSLEKTQSVLLDELMASPDAPRDVIFRGVLDGVEKQHEYLRADVFVFPSYAEAFPTVVLEAMAAGLPVVGTRVGALPEVFSDEEIRFVDVGDVEGLASACVELGTDLVLRKKMGQAAARRVSKDFSLKNYVSSTCESISALVSTSRSPRCGKLTPGQESLDSVIGSTRVLLFGHYGGSNTGDEAMLTALCDWLGEVKGVEGRYLTKAASGCLGSSLDRIDFSSMALFRNIFWADVVCLGGGTHFHDDYRLRRYLRHYLYMVRIAMAAGLTRLLGKRFVMTGMGFGPIEMISTSLVTKLAVAWSDFVSVRDAQSMIELEKLGVEEGVVEGFDLVGMLEGGVSELREQNLVGISIAYSESFGFRGAGSCEWWEFFCDALVRLGRSNSSLVFRTIIIRGGERESDGELTMMVNQRLRQDLGDQRVHNVDYTDDPRVIMSAISECSYMIATRYHAALMAYLSGCRLLLLSYHRKLADLKREIGLADAMCFDFRDPRKWKDLSASLDLLINGSELSVARLDFSEARRRARRNRFL